MNEPIVLSHITKRYKPTLPPAVEDISLAIKPGEFVCLVGPSGCGKSTILKIIAGLEKPTEGSISITGEIAMAFQSGALLPWQTVGENVGFGLHMQSVPKHVIAEKVNHYLSLVDLLALEHAYPRELSGGQKQRVGLARALSVERPILLLDEPFSALDTLTTDELHEYLLKIWQETKKTIVMVSHSLEEAVLLADRVAVMKLGKLFEILPIVLPRPRGEDPQVLALSKKIKHAFREE